MNKEEFILECKKININITDDIYNQLIKYQQLLVFWNEKINLTTILEEKEVLLKHFYDSLCLIKAIDLNNISSLCDFGTGAGFPGIVIKIVFPNIKVVLIESATKKCIFLNDIIDKFNLKDIEVINERVEIYAKNNREIYDVVTCRAVSHLAVISELAIPLVKINGYFIPLKGNASIELTESRQIIKELGGEIIKIYNYTLPIEDSIRTIIKIKKIVKCPIVYPREYSRIVKKHLIKDKK